MQRKWYVFDQFDCMGGPYEKADVAAGHAELLVANGFERLEIRHMTEAEFNAYCESDAAYNALIEADA